MKLFGPNTTKIDTLLYQGSNDASQVRPELIPMEVCWSVICLIADAAIGRVLEAFAKNVGESFKREDIEGDAAAALTTLLPQVGTTFALLSLPASLVLPFSEGAIFKGTVDQSGRDALELILQGGGFWFDTILAWDSDIQAAVITINETDKTTLGKKFPPPRAKSQQAWATSPFVTPAVVSDDDDASSRGH